MSAHTPGPWELIGTAIEHHPRGKPATVICYLEDEHTDEWAANARLIAAAPRMLAAIKEISACYFEAGHRQWSATHLQTAIFAACDILRDLEVKNHG